MLPYGNAAATQWLAMWASRHMHEFGTTEEHLAEVAISTRQWASMNERAIARDPITLDDYFASPYVAEPFRRLDCDFPVDAGVAVVLASPERARELAHRPVWVRTTSLAPGPRPDWVQPVSFTEMSAAYCARDMWQHAGGLTADDVDLALVYDGFTFLTLSWMEAFGFCGLGESGPFVADGALRPGGALPTNTHGGNLSEGRTHGMGHVAEAVRQLQGRAGDRQVPDAQVAVVSGGGGPLAGAMLLHTMDPA
jgi:acetyl-CoA acetyltransferase